MATAPDFALNGWEEPEAERARMTQEEIVSILREQERASVNFRDTILAGEQAAALDFYEAEPFGDEQPGRSQVVVPDVAEVVDYMQISVLRTVASADRVVEFEPGDTDQVPDLPEPPEAPQMPQGDVPPEQQAMMAQAMARYQGEKAEHDAAVAAYRRWEKGRDKAADDATAAVNHIFMRRQNGYRILLDWLQSGLIEKIGIVKTACVTERKRVRQMGTVSADELALMEQEGAPLSNVTDRGDGTFDVVVAIWQDVKRYRDYPIPSEEFIFPPRTKDEDEARYLAHRARKTLSDLVEMGFDREKVEALPTDDGVSEVDDQRTWARWGDDNLSAYQRAPSMREVLLLEEYARLDLDDDGVAELWQIFRVGDVILDMNEVEEAPFVVWTPFPRAHRLVGNSLAEKTMDIQRVDSVLLRQALDGVYMTNSPRTWLPQESMTEDTIDDLLTVIPGGIVRGRGSLPPQKLNDAFDIQKSLGMLEFMQGQRETRTGITRLNQGLDEDTINKTATGQAALQAQGQQMEEAVARNFGEAMGRLFAKKLRLMRANGEPIAIKVEGSYRRIDPTTWDDDMNVVVRVGLGSGRKEQRIVYRGQIAQQQAEALQAGLPIVDPVRIYKNAAGYVRDAGLGNPDDYWLDPESEEAKAIAQAKPPQQDPALVKVQGEQQLAAQKMQGEEQRSQQQIALSQQEAAAKLGITQREGEQRLRFDAERAAMEQQLAREKAEFEANLATMKADREWELAQAQMAHAMEMDRVRAGHAHEQGMEKARMSVNRPGGDLDK